MVELLCMCYLSLFVITYMDICNAPWQITHAEQYIWIHICNTPLNITHPYTLSFFVTVSHWLNCFQVWSTSTEIFFCRLLLNWSFHMLHSCSWLRLSKYKTFCLCWMYSAYFWKSVNSLWQPLFCESQFNPLVVENSRTTNK